jgi:transcription elongation factor
LEQEEEGKGMGERARDFKPGDLVEVLSGDHAGRVGRVLGKGHGEGMMVVEVRRRAWPYGHELARVKGWQLDMVREA